MEIVFCEKSNTVSARDLAILISRLSPHWLKETHLRYNLLKNNRFFNILSLHELITDTIR